VDKCLAEATLSSSLQTSESK